MSQPPRTPRAPRFDLRIAAEIRIGSRVTTATTRNLSSGGVCLETNDPLTEGSQLQLTLFPVEDGVEAEGKRGLDLEGRVQWTAESERGWANGIQFINMNSTQSTAITAALKTIGD